MRAPGPAAPSVGMTKRTEEVVHCPGQITVEEAIAEALREAAEAATEAA